VNVVTTGSGLNNEQKSQLKNRINAIGGSVLNNWEESCTHITTQELMLTVKVLHALVDDKPIVKLEYWDQLLQNMKELKPPPDVSDFEPPVAESLINKTKMSFNPTRRILFTNKTFVFATEKIRLKNGRSYCKNGRAQYFVGKAVFIIITSYKIKK
jgi:nijmegen breakage syndrome protein 1